MGCAIFYSFNVTAILLVMAVVEKTVFTLPTVLGGETGITGLFWMGGVGCLPVPGPPTAPPALMAMDFSCWASIVIESGMLSTQSTLPGLLSMVMGFWEKSFEV